MRIPHTIPKILLRAFTRKLDEDALKKSYEGRTLISEDPTWDKELAPNLAQQCLNIVIDEFLFFDKFIEFFNENKLQEYEKRKAQWEKDLAEYIEKRKIYEKKLADYERMLKYGIQDTDYDDDDDDDDQDPNKGPKKPVEPEKVDDDFPEFEPIPSLLDHLKDDHRVQVVEDIELELVPFPLAVKIIPDEFYWERLARERWQVYDITDHNKSWRRMYMEKHAWDALERFHPADDDFDKLKADLDVVSEEVIRLRIQNLIPICFGTPAKEVQLKQFEGDNEFSPDPEFDAGFGDADMFDDPDDEGVELNESTVKAFTNKKGQKKNKNSTGSTKSGSEGDYIVPPDKRNPEMDRSDPSHIDFSLILPIFSNLKELYIVYEMVETGLDWEERYFKFTDTDCLNLAKAVASTPTLEKIEVLRSHMTGEQCKTLVREGLIKMAHLKYLSLNYNRIDDVGARAVARLLMDERSKVMHTLHTLRLARNRIHNAGGKALAFALSRNTHLSILDVRLNSLGDPAGMDLGHALARNANLVAIFLGANKMTEESAYIFGKMLFHNKTLREMDVSSNDLGKKGGEYLALGMRNNKTILRLDVRCSNIGLDFEYDVGTHLRKNRNRIGAIRSIVDAEDYMPTETESVFLDLEEISSDMSDEEEEQDEDEEEEEDEEEGAGAGDGEGEDEWAPPPAPPAEKSIAGITAEALARANIPGLGDPVAALNDPKIAAIIAKAVGADPAKVVPGYQGAGDANPKTKENTKGESTAAKNKGKKVEKVNENVKELKVVKEPSEMKRSQHTLV